MEIENSRMMIEVVEPKSPDTAMAEAIKVERAESPEIRITDSPLPPLTGVTRCDQILTGDQMLTGVTSNASSPSHPPTPASSSSYAKSPMGSPQGRIV